MSEINIKCTECGIYSSLSESLVSNQTRLYLDHKTHVLIYNPRSDETSSLTQIENFMDFIAVNFVQVCNVVNKYLTENKNSVIICDLNYYMEFLDKIVFQVYNKKITPVDVIKTETYISMIIDKIHIYLISPTIAIDFVRNIDIDNLTFILNDNTLKKQCIDLFLQSKNMQKSKHIILAFKMDKDGNYPIDFHDILTENGKGNINIINFANPNATKQVMRNSILNLIGDHKTIHEVDSEASQSVNFIIDGNTVIEI